MPETVEPVIPRLSVDIHFGARVVYLQLS